MRSCVTKLSVLAILASTGSIPRNIDEYLTDGSIANTSRLRGCYVSYGIIITIVTYLQYLYSVVLENYYVARKKKIENVFLRIMVRAY